MAWLPSTRRSLRRTAIFLGIKNGAKTVGRREMRVKWVKFHGIFTDFLGDLRVFFPSFWSTSNEGHLPKGGFVLLEYLVGPSGPGAKARQGPLLDAPAIDGISWENIVNKWFHIQDNLTMLKTYWCLLMNYLHSVLIWHLQMVANTFFFNINTCPPKLGIFASLTGWNDPATTDDPSFYPNMFQVFSASTPEVISKMTPSSIPMLPNLPLTSTFSHPPSVKIAEWLERVVSLTGPGPSGDLPWVLQVVLWQQRAKQDRCSETIHED